MIKCYFDRDSELSKGRSNKRVIEDWKFGDQPHVEPKPPGLTSHFPGSWQRTGMAGGRDAPPSPQAYFQEKWECLTRGHQHQIQVFSHTDGHRAERSWTLKLYLERTPCQTLSPFLETGSLSGLTRVSRLLMGSLGLKIRDSRAKSRLRKLPGPKTTPGDSTTVRYLDSNNHQVLPVNDE